MNFRRCTCMVCLQTCFWYFSLKPIYNQYVVIWKYWSYRSLWLRFLYAATVDELYQVVFMTEKSHDFCMCHCLKTWFYDYILSVHLHLHYITDVKGVNTEFELVQTINREKWKSIVGSLEIQGTWRKRRLYLLIDFVSLSCQKKFLCL